MATIDNCERCGRALQVLQKPVRQLRWSRHWMTGVKSLFTGQLWVCHQCGAIYSSEGELLAAGAIETDSEQRIDVYRKDMSHLRNAFGGVVIAAEALAAWLAFGPEAFELGRVIATASLGGVAFFPFLYFGHKAAIAKRDLKRLRKARQSGQIPGPPSQP